MTMTLEQALALSDLAAPAPRQAGEALRVLRAEIERLRAEPMACCSDVTRQLIERDQRGRAKYGTTLDRTDLTLADWLQHMAEELLDAAGYALAARRSVAQPGAVPPAADAHPGHEDAP